MFGVRADGFVALAITNIRIPGMQRMDNPNKVNHAYLVIFCFSNLRDNKM